MRPSRKKRAPKGGKREPKRPLTAAEKALVAAHMPLVHTVAKRIAFRVPWAEASDLVSPGAEGLMDAARRFDPAHGKPFAAFAEWRIKGAILDELRDHDFLSRDMRRWANAIADAEHHLRGRLGRAPTHAELAREMGLTPDELDARRQKLAGHTIVAFDDEDPDVRDQAAAADDPGVSPFGRLSRAQARATLEQALARLRPRDQQVLSLRYAEDLTLGEVGRVLGVTESRACQLLRDATGRLRELVDPDLMLDLN